VDLETSSHGVGGGGGGGTPRPPVRARAFSLRGAPKLTLTSVLLTLLGEVREKKRRGRRQFLA